MPAINETTTEKIIELCDLILVYADKLDFDKGKNYIEDYIREGVSLTDEKNDIRRIVQNQITQYIGNYSEPEQLFLFASDNDFQRYRIQFREYYMNFSHKADPSPPSPHSFPRAFDTIFDCVQEAIDFQTLFHALSIRLQDTTVKQAKEEAVEASRQAAMSAKVAAKTAQRASAEAAKKAANVAIDDVLNSHMMENRISESIDSQMNKVTSKISETSVTILGIFSGIVLTVVAGLFYSSSVINNVNAANFYRLIFTAALVGLVCLHLLVALFHFIETINRSSKKDVPSGTNPSHNKWPISDKLVLVVSLVLIAIMLGTVVLHFVFPEKVDFNIENEQSGMTISNNSGDGPYDDSLFVDDISN